MVIHPKVVFRYKLLRLELVTPNVALKGSSLPQLFYGCKCLGQACFLYIKKKRNSANIDHPKYQSGVGPVTHLQQSVLGLPYLPPSIFVCGYSAWLTVVRLGPSPNIFHEQFIALPFPLLYAPSSSTKPGFRIYHYVLNCILHCSAC